LRPRILNRNRLTERFLSRLDRQLTLVEAPAGYGKTTLLKSWYRQLKDMDAVASWISADPSVEDFTNALEAALAMRTAQRSRNPLGIASPCNLSRQGAFLFIDDFHDASKFACDWIGSLLQRREENLHIIIGTRLSPAIALAKLRLEDAVTDFGMDDLKFHRHEAEALFGVGFPVEKVRQYYDVSEGWPAALQLMVMSSAKGHALDFGKNSASVLDLGSYLNEQFLNSLSDAQNRFLLETAHLNPINGDLADYVRNSNDSWDMLASISQAHSLVYEQTEMDFGWYTYHQLLQDYLLIRQQTLGEKVRNELRVRAAHWFNDHGRLYSASKLAMEAGEIELAERIILEAGGIEIGILHGAQRLKSLLDLLPLNWVNSSRRLSLARAYLLLKSGRTGEAQLLIQDVRKSSNDDDRELQREIVLLEVHLRLYEDRNITRAQVSALEYTAQNTPLKDQLCRGVLHNFLCLFYIQLGDLKKARTAGEIAMALYTDLGCNHLIFFMHINLSVVDMDLGDCAKAYVRRKFACQLQVEYFGHDANLSAISTIMLAEAALEANEAVALEAPLIKALKDADSREGWSEVFLAGYETDLTMKLQKEGFRDAMSLVSQGEAMASRRGLPRFSRLLKILELDVAVRSGREVDARRLVGSLKLLLREKAGDKGFRWRSRLLARLGLTQFESRFGDPETAVDLSQALIRDCRRWGLRRYELRALVLQMIASVAQGDTSGAATILRDALALGQSHSMMGAFIREGDGFSKAARIIVRERGVAALSQDALTFLSKLLSRVQDSDEGKNILSEILTMQEFAVLSSLCEGNANKVIARALELSEPTVKFHLQNIYRKLGVNSRKLAIELASHYGLVSEQ